MQDILPIVIGCGVGIALCIIYLLCLGTRALLRKFWANHPKRIEIDDNVLTIEIKKGQK